MFQKVFRHRFTLSIKARWLVARQFSVGQRDSKPGALYDGNLTQFVAEFRNPLSQLFLLIGSNSSCTEKATSLGITAHSWHVFLAGLRRKIMKDPEETLGDEGLSALCDTVRTTSFMQRAELVPEDADDKAAKYLFDIALHRAETHFKDSIALHRTLCNMTDLRAPHEWYPSTRMRRRKVIYHGGPTNSGKTYQALQRLRQADPEQGGGLYCGPLRLLALEVYESLNRSGIYCDLRTGQEIRTVPLSTHVSSTLEMVNLNKEYDVVVIDEIQMIADAQRGYAWTKTVLGIQANEIHVCGGLEAFEIVKALMEQTQDSFELCKYERMSNLVIAEESLRGNYSSVRPGDCIVAFSRKEIFAIKAEIEKLTDHKCAVIYGQLPSDIRSEQARLFNELDTGYDVLVASDAIGMGLNLNIGRIIFHTTLKRGHQNMVLENGQKAPSVYFVDPSNIKQIAGRAGRRSSQYDVGTVTAWQDSDLAYVRAVMQYDIPQIKAAGLFPSIEQIEEFSERLASVSSLAAVPDAEPEADETDGVDGNGALVTVAAAADGEEATASSPASDGAASANYKDLLQRLVLKHSRAPKPPIVYSSVSMEGAAGRVARVTVSLPDQPEYVFTSDALNSTFSNRKAAEQGAAKVAYEALSHKLSSRAAAADRGDGGEASATEEESTALAVADPNYIQLSNVLDRFLQLSQVDGGQYFMCNSSDIVLVSNWLHTIPMTISERFVFANAPVNTGDALTMNQLYVFAASYAMRRPVGIAMVLPTLQPRDLIEFSDLCVKHNILELYIWLSIRFPQFFVEREACLARREHTLGMIEATLMGSALKAKGTLNEDYLRLWKKLGAATGDTYLPPDTDAYAAVRPAAAEFLAKLPSREPVFREGTGTGKPSAFSSKVKKSFFSKASEKEKPVPKESKSGLWKKTVPGEESSSATQQDAKKAKTGSTKAKTKPKPSASNTWAKKSGGESRVAIKQSGDSKPTVFKRVAKTPKSATDTAASAAPVSES